MVLILFWKRFLLKKAPFKNEKNFGETSRLLARDNINFDALCEYARDAAHAAINKKLDKSQLIFTKNDSGSNDVSMFDFTSLYQAVNSSRIVEKRGHKLFLSLVGDSLVMALFFDPFGWSSSFLLVMNNKNELEIVHIVRLYEVIFGNEFCKNGCFKNNSISQ